MRNKITWMALFVLCAWAWLASAQQQDIRRGGGGGQPASGNLTNWSNITTNEVVFTNQFRVYTNSLLAYFQFGSGNLTNFSGVTTNEVVYTNQFRVYTNSLSLVYQAGSANLTNLSGITTNEFVYTNQFRTFTNGLPAIYQAGSANLTNFAGVTTNEVVFTNTFRLFTNYVNTNYTVTGVAAGTNGIVATTNAGVVTISNTKKFVNYSFTQDTNSASTTSQIPTDDTIPQSSEGAQFGTYSYTAAASGNVVLVKISGYETTLLGSACTVALFLDSETDARAATITSQAAAGIGAFSAVYKYTTTDTSSHTWAVRFGPSSGTTAYINRSTGGTLYSSRDYVTVEFWEFLP